MKYKVCLAVADSPKFRGHARMSDAVRQVLRDCHKADDFNLCYVSEKLCMSTRTVSRKLHGEGTKFQYILDEERKQLCLELMKNGVTEALDLAVSLGIADTSHFYRKFKLWFDVNFREYKDVKTKGIVTANI